MPGYSELVKSIQGEKFIVYGAGGYGQKFVKAVFKMGYGNNFLGYAVTCKKEEGMTGICEIHQVDRKCLIVVAAHDRNAEQMEQNLADLGFEHYLSIYSCLTELFWGLPYETGVELKVEKLVQGNRDANYCAALYGAIDYIMGNNKGGKDLYIKTLSLLSDYETAYGRWEQYEERIRAYKNGGVPEQYPIKVDLEHFCILDGFHRLMLAYYFHYPIILADLYNINMMDYEDFYHRSVYTDQNFCNTLTGDEQNIIRTFRQKIKRHVNEDRIAYQTGAG